MAQVLFNGTPIRVLIDNTQSNLFAEIGQLAKVPTDSFSRLSLLANSWPT